MFEFLRCPQACRDFLDGAGIDGHPVLDTGDPDDVGIRRQHIAVNLDVDEMLGRLGTGQQPGDQDEERQHVSACPEYRLLS